LLSRKYWGMEILVRRKINNDILCGEFKPDVIINNIKKIPKLHIVQVNKLIDGPHVNPLLKNFWRMSESGMFHRCTWRRSRKTVNEHCFVHSPPDYACLIVDDETYKKIIL